MEGYGPQALSMGGAAAAYDNGTAGMMNNPATLQLWTGEPAFMSTEPGSEFSLWEGSIEGRNIEFEEGKKIVQQWYFGEQEEPSIVTLKLHEHKKGTSFEVNHANIPEEAYDDIVAGWTETYVESLLEFYEDEEESN